jgi:Ca-activated chloride channel family protein
MFRFEHPEYLYALALIPLLLVLYVLMQAARRRAFRRFASRRLIGQLMPSMSRYKHSLKFILLMLALAFLIVGWANPQWGTKKESVERRSVDVFVALDISQSMLATDVPPSRLERSRRFVQDLFRALAGERIGLILFAGNAYLQMPLTTDYAAADLFVRSANPEMAPTQGTAISEAIDLASRSFDPENVNHKALVLVTDGENHEEAALQAAREAAKKGLLLYTVGVGTAEGSLIPMRIAGRSDFKRDQSGNPVRTRLDEGMLEQLANAGDGVYFNLSAGSDEVINALRARIDQMEKRALEQRVFSDYESYFAWFLGIALFLIVAEFFVSYRKSRFFARDLFNQS